MALPLHELAALGTATCWATTGLFAADAVRSLGAFHFNLIRQLFVTLLLALIVLATGGFNQPDSGTLLTLGISGLFRTLLGDTLNFAPANGQARFVGHVPRWQSEVWR
ncbi:EamA family transporter [Cypionkella sp.]|uniref:EamA family transporter n=1 Tax=Cypionkella sp. TaxID=2811411 RepID=UPI0026315FAC|nr:EamA family transporter [Cypionkella sp.]MDB5663999.1 eamA-like transporter family protein [Cypionkella sp.]